MSTETTSVRDEVVKMKGAGRTVKEITDQLAQLGFLSNRGKPYSASSIQQMFAKKEKVATKAPKKAAPQETKTEAAPRELGKVIYNDANKLSHVKAVIDSPLQSEVKVMLLQKYLN